jgi:hypothetical protein
MRMVEIIADFIQYGGNINNPRATIMIIKIHFARNRHDFSTANIPCSNQEGWTTTTSNVVRKAPKITQLEHKKKITQGTSALIYRPGRSVSKKTWPFIPCRSAFTHAPKRSPTVPNAGNSIAFIGG